MKVAEEKNGDVTIFRVEGEININTSPDLRRSFDGLIKANSQKIVIDFAKVPYIDSSGLATLIELLQRLKKINGHLRMCNMSDKVKSVFVKLMSGKIRPVEYFENPVLNKKGEERLIAWHNTILTDDHGNIVGILSSGTDITEQKKVEESLQKSDTKSSWYRLV